MIYAFNKTDKFFKSSFHDGYIRSSYNDLKNVFGKHHDISGDGKCSAIWALECPNVNVQFMIYDWKEYDNYPVDNPDKVYDFHIRTNTKQNTKKIVCVLQESGFDAFILR